MAKKKGPACARGETSHGLTADVDGELAQEPLGRRAGTVA